MTAAEYRETLDSIGWSAREVARRLGVSAASAQRWRLGRAPVPAAIATWLRRIEDAVTRHPPPPAPE